MKAEDLAKRRENLGLTREGLARDLKTTYTPVYRWETGERSVPAYLDLALETLERRQQDQEAEKAGA